MYLKQTFLSTTKFRGAQKCFVGHCPRISPVWLRAWDHRQRMKEEEKKKPRKDVIRTACVQRYRYADGQQAMNRWYCSRGSFNSLELPKVHARFSIHVLDNGQHNIFLSQCYLTKCLNCLSKIVVICGVELTAPEGEYASSKMLKLKKHIFSRIPHRKILTGQLSGTFLNNYVEFANGSASSSSDVTFYNLTNNFFF